MSSKAYSFWVRDKKHAWVAARSKEPAAKKGRVIVDIANRGGVSSSTVTIKEVGPLKWDPQDKSRDGKPNVLRAHGSHFGNNIWDIAKLNDMNEAAMIDVLRRRFAEGTIYTQVSDILIIVNPYTFIDGLYDIGPPTQYKLHESDPHIYVTAESVFTCMMSGDPTSKLNQSVIVSGESGAGKTEACKSVMRYLAARSSTVTTAARRASNIARRQSVAHNRLKATANIEQRVLACNPFLEAFGNAKTLMNDNSSRFGKFLRILYREGHIVGASMETYLLEKGRIVGQGPMERGYHIFYQMCKGLTPNERRTLGLGSATDYRMLVQGGASAVNVDSIDDKADFIEAREAMATVGIDAAQQWEIFQILTGLLELNNVEWSNTGARGASVKGSPAASQAKAKNRTVLAHAAELLGLRSGEGPMGIEYQLSMRINASARSSGSVIYRALDEVQCAAAVAALTKHTYSIVFDWLVAQVNDRLKPEVGDDPQSYIGILDIFGFEIFEHNSFEQLCINFANEKLQRLFQTHVFENEQKTYEAEGIPLHHLNFVSNVHCITLIEGRDAGSGYNGIMHVLDEFSKTERDIDTDSTYAALLLKQFGGKKKGGSGKAAKMYAVAGKYIEFPKFPPVEWFRIKHFAGPVKYEFANFLEKNRDKTFVHLKQMMAKSKRPFISRLFKTMGGGSKTKRKQEVPTIAGKFIKQLQGLTKTILKTRNHYVRCVKPNDKKLAYNRGGDAFDAPKVLRQLLYAGVMATIEIRQAGFPYRESLESFWERSVKNKWHIFAQVEEDVGPRIGIQAVLDTVFRDQKLKEPLAIVGRTRVFGKDHLISGLREWHQAKVCDRLQNFARSKLARLAFKKKWDEKMARKYAKNYYAKVLGRAVAASMYVQGLRDKFQAELEKARVAEEQRLAAIAAENARVEAEARAARERAEASARAEAEAAEREAARQAAAFEAEQARQEAARRQRAIDSAARLATEAAIAAANAAYELAYDAAKAAADAAEREADYRARVELSIRINDAAEKAAVAARAAADYVSSISAQVDAVIEAMVKRAAEAAAEMERIRNKTDDAMREAELLGRSPFSVLDRTVFNMQNSVYRYTLRSAQDRPAESAPTAALMDPQWMISHPSDRLPAAADPAPSSSALESLERFTSNGASSYSSAQVSPSSHAAYGSSSAAASPVRGGGGGYARAPAPAPGSGYGVGRNYAHESTSSTGGSAAWTPYQFSPSPSSKAAMTMAEAASTPLAAHGTPLVHVSRRGSVEVYAGGVATRVVSGGASSAPLATPQPTSSSPAQEESPRMARLAQMERMISEQEAELQSISRQMLSPERK